MQKQRSLPSKTQEQPGPTEVITSICATTVSVTVFVGEHRDMLVMLFPLICSVTFRGAVFGHGA